MSHKLVHSTNTCFTVSGSLQIHDLTHDSFKIHGNMKGKGL